MRNALPRSFLSSALLLLLTACSSNNNTCVDGCSAGLSCVQNSDFPAGACTAACEDGGCPSSSVCSPFLSSGQKYCLQDCATAGCAGAMLCTLTSKGKLCLPASEAVARPITCAKPQLLVGPSAGPATDPGCRLPVVPSALPPGDIQELGIFSPGTQVSFNVPPGAVGFSIVSQAVATGNAFIDCYGQLVANVPVPTPVLTPTGASFFDIAANVPSDWTKAPLVFSGIGSP
jgi:hypothetical protein